MGMTKAMQERIFIAGQHRCSRDTRFVCVRYGNVLASRGSVIPLFHDQIRNGGPVTITTAEMTRFLLSLDDAVDTSSRRSARRVRGETYIPRVPSARVVDIAAALIGERDIRTSSHRRSARARSRTRSWSREEEATPHRRRGELLRDRADAARAAATRGQHVARRCDGVQLGRLSCSTTRGTWSCSARTG